MLRVSSRGAEAWEETEIGVAPYKLLTVPRVLFFPVGAGA